MKTLRTAVTNRTLGRTTLGAFAALALSLLVITPSTAKADKPLIFEMDFEFEYLICDTPVLAHYTGRIIERFGDSEYTLVEPLQAVWTNPANGKTVTTISAGTLTGSYYEGVFLYNGVVIIQQENGAWVDAGLTETVLEFDPETGEVTEVVIRSAGTQNFGGLFDALCAALQ